MWHSTRGTTVNEMSSPVVQRRRLRTELRRARQDAGLTQEAVAAEMDWSLSKIIRIETGSVGVSTNDLTALLRLYQVADAEQTKELIELARGARQQSWWSKYRSSISPVYFQYIEYESAASAVREYQSLVIPGLLQTEEYATALIRQHRQNFSPKRVRTLVEIRLTRQKLLLDQAKPHQLFFILDEGVIRRLLGDKELRQPQIARLISMADMKNVTIQVLPFGAGIHRGMAESFDILQFNDGADVLYFESSREAIFSRDEAEEVSTYRELFGHLKAIALGREETRRFLQEIADDIESPQVMLVSSPLSEVISKWRRLG